MLKELSPLYKSLEDKRRELLKYMDGISEAERQRKPNPKELSPIQVLAHIVKVEETVAGPGTSPKLKSKVGLKGRVFMATMVNLMRPGFRIPTTPVLHPSVPDSYHELKQSWERTRQELTSRVERTTESAKNQPITDHMMAGPLSAAMALEFLDIHLRYHWKNFPRQSQKTPLRNSR